MDDYLSKPIQPGELERVLAQWLPRNGDRAPRSSLPAPNPSHEPGAGSPDEDPLDPDLLARLHDDLEPGMRERLLGTFENSLHERLTELDRALANGDERELDRILHLLKGSSATIGARELSEACQALRVLAPSDRAGLGDQLAHLDTIAGRAIVQLRRRLLDADGLSPTLT